MRKVALAAAMFAAGWGFSAADAGPLASGRQIALDVGTFFTPSQYDADGAVYGVRARGSNLPSLQVLSSDARPLDTITPAACSTAGFPGGWCNTPHNIARKAFGWDFHAKGAGAVIGIVDTGIDINHPEFAGRILAGTCFAWSQNPCTDPTNDVGGDIGVFPAQSTHGTHVAGIAAGANVGLASKAEILPVKVCATFSDACNRVDDGIVWASEHGANIINVSIGGPILSTTDVSAFQTAVANGSLLVVAGGNSGTKYPTGGFLAGAALDDGVRGSMIVVGATGCNGPSAFKPKSCANGGLGGAASFTQVPGTRCEVHGGQRFCMKDFFVVAPGVDIWSSVGNGAKKKGAYGYLSGTSMATPYVTGVAALIKGQDPALTSEQIADIIFQTTDDIGAPGVDRVFGRGVVDVTKALSPVGGAEVRVATGGGNAQTATGPTGALTSLVTGPLAGALANSKLLKHAVIVDKFGRPFKADLTKAAYNKGLQFDGLLQQQLYSYSTFTPFAFSAPSPIGSFVASGYAVDTVTPRLLTGGYLDRDLNRYNVRDLWIAAPLMGGVTLNAGFNLDMEGRFNDYDADASPAYDGLFLSASAVNSPYLGFTDGGSFLGATIALADDLHFRIGASQLSPPSDPFQVPLFASLAQLQGPQLQFDQRQASAAMAGLSWDFAKWGGLGMTLSQSSEQNGLLGGLSSGALDLANSANTSAVGLSARVGFGDGWVTTASYSEGITQLDLRAANSLVTSADTLHSRSYGIAVAKHGLFGDDSLGLSVSRPIEVYSGNVSLAVADNIDKNNNLIMGHENLSLATRTPETDFELGYVTTFLDGAVALQANAAYQMNLQGQNGQNAVSVLSRAKINF